MVSEVSCQAAPVFYLQGLLRQAPVEAGQGFPEKNVVLESSEAKVASSATRAPGLEAVGQDECVCLQGLLELSWLEPETSAGLQRDTWRKLCGLVGAGQGRKKELLGVTGCLLTYQCLQTCEQERHREAARTRTEALLSSARSHI